MACRVFRSSTVGHQAALIIRAVEIFEDQARLDEHQITVDERRHNPVGIQLEIFRVVLIPLGKVENDAFIVEPDLS